MILEMGTTTRHNNLITGLGRFIMNILWDSILNKKAIVLLEQLHLCHMGERKDLESIELIDAKDTKLLDNSINTLHVVQPDIMVFNSNAFYTNSAETRYIGKPDLLVEIWSESNSNLDRIFKKTLYSTSSITEHWYIEQYSNEIECWLGNNQLSGQNLNNILKTTQNIELDLRYLAL